METACSYAKLGCQVTVIELMAGILPGIDPELVKRFRLFPWERLLSERHAFDNDATLSPAIAITVDPRDYYRALTNEDPPAELAALVEASDAPYRRFAPDELRFADGPRPTSPWWIGASAFQDRYCDFPAVQKSWCVLEKREDDYKERHDVNGVSSRACAERGNVELRAALRPRGTWERSQWTVLEGDCRWWWTSRGRDFDAEAAVLEAQGDKFHHAGMMCWGGGGECPVILPQ